MIGRKRKTERGRKDAKKVLVKKCQREREIEKESWRNTESERKRYGEMIR